MIEPAEPRERFCAAVTGWRDLGFQGYNWSCRLALASGKWARVDRRTTEARALRCPGDLAERELVNREHGSQLLQCAWSLACAMSASYLR